MGTGSLIGQLRQIPPTEPGIDPQTTRPGDQYAG
jgi:hypothetical protein